MPSSSSRTAPKIPTGIDGFDGLTDGGLPVGRTTLLTGGPGAGKTLLALQTLAAAARTRGEPGIFVAFEEPADRLIADASAFGWGLEQLTEAGELLFVDADLSNAVLQDGGFDLLGLVARLEAMALRSGARWIALDGLDVLLHALGSAQAARSEAHRLHGWLRKIGLTALMTAKTESGTTHLPAEQAYVEFLADAIVSLDLDLQDPVAKRSIRVKKLRGSAHVVDRMPLIIGPKGLEVVTEGYGRLEHPASTERVTSGVARLDEMLGGGYFRGSSILVSGAPGAAKSTLAGAFAEASCRRGARTLFVSFDESPQQIVRNLSSVGILLKPHRDEGLLSQVSLQGHVSNPDRIVARIRDLVEEHGAETLIVDPLSALIVSRGGDRTADDAAQRLIDLAKRRGVTILSTSLLLSAEPASEASAVGVSTTADSWIHLTNRPVAGERNRTLTIVKSRGMKHSQQVRELVLGDRGIELADVYTAGGEVLMGTLRYEREAEVEAKRGRERRRRERERRRIADEIQELKASFERVRQQLSHRESELEELRAEEERDEVRRDRRRDAVRVLRGGGDARRPDEEAGR